jgi:hypothetical protein
VSEGNVVRNRDELVPGTFFHFFGAWEDKHGALDLLDVHTRRDNSSSRKRSLAALRLTVQHAGKMLVGLAWGSVFGGAAGNTAEAFACVVGPHFSVGNLFVDRLRGLREENNRV